MATPYGIIVCIVLLRFWWIFNIEGVVTLTFIEKEAEDADHDD